MMMHSSITPTTQESSDDSTKRHSNCSTTNLSDYTRTKPNFKFLLEERLSKSLTNSCVSSQSDSSAASLDPTTNCNKKNNKKRKNRRGVPNLPALGIFWDIENCQVPKNKSASAVVQRTREFFLEQYREAEFLVVCDVKKERPQVVQELHDAQVTVIHVASTSKNACDEKLRQSLRRFAEVHKAPSCVVLISGDINFASDLSDLRYRKKIRVILVHSSNVADALILCANEHYHYSVITEGLPEEKTKIINQDSFLLITNLPTSLQLSVIKKRLKLLTNNCGGRVVELDREEGCAVVKFSTQDTANRAQRRIQGEDVCGKKITVVTSALRNYAGRKVRSGDAALQGFPVYKGNQARGFASQPEVLQNIQGINDTQESSLRPLRGMDFPSTSFDCTTTRSQSRSFTNITHQDTLLPLSGRIRQISGSSDYSDDSRTCMVENNTTIKLGQPVDLMISNLDASIGIEELKNLLSNMIRDNAMILKMNIYLQTDGNPLAYIRVLNQQAAQFIISQLHRQKIGQRKIIISYANTTSCDTEHLKAMVVSILQEARDNRMPLFKFLELLESRYNCTVPVSEIKKLKDVCQITENLGSRMISFAQEYKAAPPSNLSKSLPYCTIHCDSNMSESGWCALSTVQYPVVMIPLKLFTAKLNSLLNSHLGSMPLLCFQICYEQQFNEPLHVDYSGVPLEHLITCVPNVQIKCSGPNKNVKIIKKESKCSDTDEESFLENMAPFLAHNVNLLCRELVDLLGSSDKCQIILNKFIPAYHHRFRRQCYVADYGFTKLLDLFESISHVIQIMGEGSRKVITLSHQAQMRRFTSDLLRVLKVQPARQISLIEYASAYEKVMNRPFNPVDYGLCYLEDLLEEVPENVIVINQHESDVIISIPKRKQTAKEVLRTKQFAMQVIDILRHLPGCKMSFDKFVPAYHHHFGQQCRVTDYGFTKLIQLFEAIPDTVKIQESPDGEREVSLTLEQSFKVLSQQIMNLVKNSNILLLEELPRIYMKEYDCALIPQTYDCGTVAEAVEKIECVQVIQSNAGPVLVAVDGDFLTELKIKIWAFLLQPPYSKEMALFKYEFKSRFNCDLLMSHLEQLRNVVSLSCVNGRNYVSLTDLYILAAQIYHILVNQGGSIPFTSLDSLFLQCFGKTLNLADYKINSLDELYEKFDFLLFIGGYKKNFLTLNRTLAEFQISLPPQIYSSFHALKKWPPLRQTVQSNVKKMSVLKPDTPPTPVKLSKIEINQKCLQEFLQTSWIYSPPKPELGDLNLELNLPIIEDPHPLCNPYGFGSPARSIFPFTRNPWGKSPDPRELPMPDKLILKGAVFDDSNDSGVNSKLENTVSDTETELGACGSDANHGISRYLNFDK